MKEGEEVGWLVDHMDHTPSSSSVINQSYIHTYTVTFTVKRTHTTTRQQQPINNKKER